VNNLIAIINASPLIYLGKVGSIQLLPQLFSEVWTCSAVKEEVLRQEQAPEIPILKQAFNSWLRISEPQNPTLLTNLSNLQLHPGEAAIIAMALELIHKRELIVIMDDSSAREIARTLNLPLTGTIGVLLKGVKSTLLSVTQFQRKLHQLLTKTEFRLSIHLYLKTIEQLRTIAPPNEKSQV